MPGWRLSPRCDRLFFHFQGEILGMYCWSCGTRGPDGARFCVTCGADLTAPPAGTSTPAPVPGGARMGGHDPRLGGHDAAGHRGSLQGWSPRSPLMLRSCPACGFRGEGIPYFRRAGNLALLAAATLFTYGVGGLVYWVLKRNDRVCPSCGLPWDRARPLGEGAHFDAEPGAMNGGGMMIPGGRGGGELSEKGAPSGTAISTRGLPGGGGLRRASGVALGLLGLLLVGLGIATAEVAAAIVGGVIGLGGASTFWWGWRAQQGRRQVLLQRMQREVIRIARGRGGRLTATEVAAELDVSMSAAERVLLSLDDGFRITSEVTDEGILVFEFREIMPPMTPPPSPPGLGSGFSSGPAPEGDPASPPPGPGPHPGE